MLCVQFWDSTVHLWTGFPFPTLDCRQISSAVSTVPEIWQQLTFLAFRCAREIKLPHGNYGATRL
jgi:hypothetical protein